MSEARTGLAETDDPERLIGRCVDVGDPGPVHGDRTLVREGRLQPALVDTLNGQLVTGYELAAERHHEHQGVHGDPIEDTVRPDGHGNAPVGSGLEITTATVEAD